MRRDKDETRVVKLECPRCHGLLTDEQRYSMAHEQGYDNWIPRHEFKGRRGFHANAMLWPHEVDKKRYPSGILSLIAEAEDEAERSHDPKRSLRVIVNTVDAEPYDPVPETEAPPDARRLFALRGDYGDIIPDGGLYLVASVDVQRNRVEVTWRSFGEDDESWGMDHVIIPGNVYDLETWKALTRELSRTWVHATGARVRLEMAFVDGGHYGDEVLRFLRLVMATAPDLHGHVRASKGFGPGPVVTGKMKHVDKSLVGHHLGTWAAKGYIYNDLRGEVPRMRFNNSYGEAFFEQLTVERVTIEWDGGQEIRKYLNDRDERNEALDLEVMCLAAMRLTQRSRNSWEAMREKIKESAAVEKANRDGTPLAASGYEEGQASDLGGFDL